MTFALYKKLKILFFLYLWFQLTYLAYITVS